MADQLNIALVEKQQDVNPGLKNTSSNVPKGTVPDIRWLLCTTRGEKNTWISYVL